MTQTGYTNAIVNVMLGWLKGLANWVLKLFNLAGSGGSPLLWLSNNWLKLLILLLIIGVVVDWLVWMIRWRPYWVWFRKKRIIVNDERFFRRTDEKDAAKDDLFECEYVVPSATVRRDERKPAAKPSSAPKRSQPVKRAAAPVRRRPGETLQQRTMEKRQTTEQSAPKRRTRPQNKDVFSDDLFEVGHNRSDYSDFFEDEVFNVSNLPGSQENDRVKRGRKRYHK